VTGKLENIPNTKPGLGAERDPGNKTEKSVEQQELNQPFKNVQPAFFLYPTPDTLLLDVK
jgi:hypothetical protein